MKAKTLIQLCVVLFLSAGCGSKSSDISEPRATIRTALTAIQEDRLEDFRATLSPELAKKIGDEPSLLKLRGELAAYQEISVGDELILSELRDSTSSEKERFINRDYSEQILGRGMSSYFKLLHMATVRCGFRTHVTMQVHQNGETPPSRQERQVQECQITQLD